MSDRVSTRTVVAPTEDAGGEEFQQLLARAETASPIARERIEGVVVGRLIGFIDGATPLVAYPAQPVSKALPARATLDLHAPQIGREVVLMFEEGNPCRPVIIGCLHAPDERSLADVPGQVEVDSDGRRLVVSAKEQIVLRCGNASITLTREGKVLIHGQYVSTRASGVNRIRGGSVQIN